MITAEVSSQVAEWLLLYISCTKAAGIRSTMKQRGIENTFLYTTHINMLVHMKNKSYCYSHTVHLDLICAERKSVSNDIKMSYVNIIYAI